MNNYSVVKTAFTLSAKNCDCNINKKMLKQNSLWIRQAVTNYTVVTKVTVNKKDTEFAVVTVVVTRIIVTDRCYRH